PRLPPASSGAVSAPHADRHHPTKSYDAPLPDRTTGQDRPGNWVRRERTLRDRTSYGERLRGFIDKRRPFAAQRHVWAIYADRHPPGQQAVRRRDPAVWRSRLIRSNEVPNNAPNDFAV